MVARRHRMDRALRTRRRSIWLVTFAILLVGGGVLALALFSPARRWQRAVGRLSVGISARQVERILGSPSVTCPPQALGHLDRSFPAGWPAGAVDWMREQMAAETRERWIYIRSETPALHCEVPAGATEIGIGGDGRVLWYVPAYGRSSLVLPADWDPHMGASADSISS